MEHAEVSAVRGEWLYEAARVSQQILCDIRASSSGAAEFVDALVLLPVPVTPVERLVRQGLILEVLLGCVDDSSCSHDQRTVSVLRRVLDTCARPSPLLASPESRAAAIIRERSAYPVDVADIARAVGCHETRLRRSFRDRFGMSMRDFHTRCRVARAIDLFAAGESKTAAVSQAVGYRSEKNFYRALRDVTGKKPTELKLMSEGRLRSMARAIVP